MPETFTGVLVKGGDSFVIPIPVDFVDRLGLVAGMKVNAVIQSVRLP